MPPTRKNGTPLFGPTLRVLVAAVLTAALVLLADRAAVASDDLSTLEEKAFRAAVDRVAPSVVRIETIGGLERIGRVLFGTGPTTGVVVAPDGYVVSSAFNFIHRPASILIQLPDGTRRPAKLVATDHNRMIALLKFDAKEQLPVPEVMPEAEAKVGQWAIAVGRAFEVNQPNMAVGVVSAPGASGARPSRPMRPSRPTTTAARSWTYGAA